MANNNNEFIPISISTTNIQLTNNGYKIPEGFNDSRQPGELVSLFDYNSNVIFSKFSPLTDYNGFLKFGPKQPFVTVNPNTYKQGLNGLKKYESRSFPIGSAPQDVVRLTKWSLTGDGVVFHTKQLLLQGLNPYNETKLYNPLMPILGASSIASFGLIPTPYRHIEPSIGGLLGAFGLGRIATAFNLDKPSFPAGTTGATNPNVLSKNSYNGQKGLLRAVTSTAGYNSILQKWQTSNLSTKFNLKNFFKSNTLFGAFSSLTQPASTIYKADEGMYGLMLNSTKLLPPTGINISDGDKSVYQMWYAGGYNTNEIRKGSESSVRSKLYKTYNNTYRLLTLKGESKYGFVVPYPKLYNKDVGLTDEQKIGEPAKYGNSVGAKISPDQDFKNSEMLVNYTLYIQDTEKYESKFNDPSNQSVQKIEENLKSVLSKLDKNAGYHINEYVTVQQFNTQTKGHDHISKDSRISTKYGLSDHHAIKNGYLERFTNQLTIDEVGGRRNLGFGASYTEDKINMRGPITGTNDPLNPYDPYMEDVIAFYFYDIVNRVTLPFRATIKGINETLNGEWNDINYLGRADKIYTYKGFSRSLSFSFTIHVGSIKELLPTWQRINYLCGLVKPSNYTGGTGAYSNFSRFIIPPLLQITIGDLYHDQPGLITSIGMSIPDDASWETLNETGVNNFDTNQDWNYLNGNIVLKNSLGKYGQFPRTVDLTLSMNLLEKEKSIMGGAQFGSSYRDSNYTNISSSGKFSEKLITSNNKIV